MSTGDIAGREAMDHLRRHGPFAPHRLPPEDPENTTMHELEQRMSDQWQPMQQVTVPAPRKLTDQVQVQRTVRA